MSRSQSAPEQSSTASSTWTWDTGIGNASVYNVAHLGESALYLKLNLVTEAQQARVLHALQNRVPPSSVFEGATIVSLSDIVELRCSIEARVLEIHHRDQTPIVVFGNKTPVHQPMYDALRRRLAPKVRPTRGALSGGGSVRGPALGLLVTLVAGPLFIWWSTVAAGRPRGIGRRRKQTFENVIELLLAKLGVEGTVGVVAGLILVLGGFVLYRLLHPYRAQVVVTRRALGVERSQSIE